MTSMIVKVKEEQQIIRTTVKNRFLLKMLILRCKIKG